MGNAHPKILKDSILFFLIDLKRMASVFARVKPHCCYCNHVVTDSTCGFKLQNASELICKYQFFSKTNLYK